VPNDVASGAVAYLSGFSDVTSLLGSYSGSDPNPGFAGRPWLFSDSNQGVLQVMEGSSAAALVLGDYGGWDVPPPLGTIRFRRLRLDVWVDPLRDASANVTETSSITDNRGLAVFAAVQFRLQRTDPDAVFWVDLCTIGCQLLTDIQFTPVPDGDWLRRGTAYFGVQCSGWSDATE
jgi:hypothetical protein